VAVLASRMELLHGSRVLACRARVHSRFIYKGDTSTHAQETDPRVALGAQGELP